MDTGRISTRYAKALYAYAAELKEEDVLFEKMKMLTGNFAAHQSLQKVMENPTVSSEDKQKLLTTAGGNSVCKSYNSLLDLLTKNRRESYAQMIALSYQKIYKKAKGIVTAKLTTVNPADEKVMQKLQTLIAGEKYKVDFITHINPKIIGGFVLDVDFNQLDASVKSQLSKIKMQLTEEKE
jgi:F-type H+-transporting ATPase subunit delta